ncbi:hypothetical protein AC579_6562 [Pseudocercospora musae]|uniref:Uncharacterized protein n=1 Tax=Pseudocercospora musae TaxID=113226 RepID=A0A139I1P6_9PEZI|nr:hypothetical protein AC579_6562 [Pseudocercospora musae]
MSLRPPPELSYPERLATFEGYWDESEATARQLAATGHVYDRPPLEALEQGSRCISCAAFMPRVASVRILEGPISDNVAGHEYHPTRGFNLHHPKCTYLQSRIPFEVRVESARTSAQFEDLKSRFEWMSTYQSPNIRQQTGAAAAAQTSSFFTLPAELRLQIYSYIMPKLDGTTSIVALNDSGRVLRDTAFKKIGRRDTTTTNLLGTCHVIYDEAIDAIFSNITYRFATSKVLYMFLRRIGHRGRQLLKSVDLVCGCREDAVTLALLAACPKLQNITLRFPRPWLIYQSAPIWVLDGVACLLQLSGLEAVRLEQAYEGKPFLSLASKDGQLLARELKRPRGAKGSIRWINGTIDA